MPKHKKLFRIVLASPSDVQADRDSLSGVIEELNEGIADHFGVHCELYKWEIDAYPGFHIDGPQGLIDDVLSIEQCDVLIGVFWKRIGTTCFDGLTGTEHEINKARASWERHHRPQIMLYFCRRPFFSESIDEIEQNASVIRFRNNLPKECFLWWYNNNLSKLVRRHLTRYIKKTHGTSDTLPKQTAFSPFMAPPDLSHFTGRRAELALLAKMLTTDQSGVTVCTVSGMPGVGKSALACRFARLNRGFFPDGVFWARVDSEEPNTIATRFSEEIGERIETIQDTNSVRSTLRRIFHDKRALLVLDNADGPDSLARIKYLLPDISEIKVIVTSRHRMLSAGLGSESLDLDAFTQEEALSLLCNILEGDARLTNEPKAVAEIIGLFGGLPLAIDIAARILSLRKNMPLSTFLEQLEKSGTLAQLNVTPRSVERLFLECINLFDSDQQNIFISLGSCVLSGFSVKTAMATCGIEQESIIGECLYKFHDMSLVQEKSDSRFSLHPLLRDFTRKATRIEESDARHCSHWLKFTSLHSRDDAQDWDILLEELEGILAAWDWCLDQSRGKVSEIECNHWASQFALNLRYFLDGTGAWKEAADRLPLALESARECKDANAEFRIRRHLALFLRKKGELEPSAEYNEANIAMARDLGRLDWVGMELEQLGRVRVRQKKYGCAEELFKEALAIARTPGTENPRYVGQNLNCLGGLYREQKRFIESIDCFEQVLSLYRERHDYQGECSTLSHLGRVLLEQGDNSRALAYFAQAIETLPQSRRVEVEGSLYQNIGLVFLSMDLFEAAEACFFLANEICVRLGIEGWGGVSVSNLFKKAQLGADTNCSDTSKNAVALTVESARKKVQFMMNRYKNAT